MGETIYIFSNGTLKRKDNTIYFENENGDKKFIPIENTREIFAFGEMSLNSKILNLLSQKSIILHYFNYYDYYAGSFYPREHYNSGYMIIQQARVYDDYYKRLKLANKFIFGAAMNSLKILRYYERRGTDSLKVEIEQIKNLLDTLDNTKTIEESMRIEGAIKEIYYKSFNKIILNNDFKFTKRTRRPPKDYLNALISFVNSLMYVYALSEIYQTHLDPRIGFLHSTNFRRFSLNLDIAEIFKVVIGDRLILSLLNKNEIKKSDFEKVLKGIVLNDNGRKKVLQKMESRLKQTINYRKLHREVSYRRLIRLEAYKIEKHITGIENYYPFIME